MNSQCLWMGCFFILWDLWRRKKEAMQDFDIFSSCNFLIDRALNVFPEKRCVAVLMLHRVLVAFPPMSVLLKGAAGRDWLRRYSWKPGWREWWGRQGGREMEMESMPRQRMASNQSSFSPGCQSVSSQWSRPTCLEPPAMSAGRPVNYSPCWHN